MKALLSFYSGVGKSVQTSMSKHTPFLLHGPKPPTWQTPGRLQYYRAENEVYLPGKQAVETHQARYKANAHYSPDANIVMLTLL